MILRIRTTWCLHIAVIVLLGVQVLLPAWVVNMIALSLSNGLVVLGLMVIMRAGLVSFGHGLFFGLGGYGAALGAVFFGISDAFVLVLLGIVASTLIAFLLGFMIASYRGIFFALLNLAFSMLLFGILVNSAVLGSTDGFSVPVPSYMGYVPSSGETRVSFLLYGLICVAVYGSALAVHRYLNSTMGYMGEAIRENEVRVDYLGGSVKKTIMVKYVISAILAGMGGAFTVLLIGHVTPEDTVFWTRSGEFVFVAILSGTGNVAAPFIGSAVFEFVRTYALQYAPEVWQMLLGGTLLLVIMFLPNGLWSLLQGGNSKGGRT